MSDYIVVPNSSSCTVSGAAPNATGSILYDGSTLSTINIINTENLTSAIGKIETRAITVNTYITNINNNKK